MSPEVASAELLVAWLLSSVVVRVGLHWRSTGSFGVVRMKARAGSLEWFGGLLFLAALIAAGLGVFVARVPVGTILFVLSIELQVRLVEEPYLSRLHRNEFANYVSKVGRFIPEIGRKQPK